MSGEEVARLVQQKAEPHFSKLANNAGELTVLCNWALMAAFHAQVLADPPLKTEHTLIDAGKNFLNHADILFGVQCKVCMGYGHSDRYCPTLPRLKAVVGPNATVNNWLNLALKKSQKSLRADGRVADQQALMNIPYGLPAGLAETGHAKKRL